MMIFVFSVRSPCKCLPRNYGRGPMRVTPEMQSAWTDYWKNGPTESMPAEKASGLLEALDSAWSSFFSGLPDGAKVLDLATGGGDVVRHAASAGRAFEITGVDIADLSAVSAAVASPHIRFVGNTDLSSLPFADASFDAITSQFGFEYSDLQASSREAMRVLAPGGRGLFVLHRSDSAITQGAVDSLAAYETVLGDGDIFKTGIDAFQVHARSAPQDQIALAETQFRQGVSALQSRLKAEPVFNIPRNVVAFLTQLAFNPRGLPDAEALHRLDAVAKSNQARNLRKRAQIDAALDREGVEKLAGLLTGMGATVHPPGDLRYPKGRFLAWHLPFQKQDGVALK